MKTAQRKPYSVPFAILKASSSPCARMMGATGPNISRCASSISIHHFGKTSRRQNRSTPAPCRALPRLHASRAFELDERESARPRFR